MNTLEKINCTFHPNISGDIPEYQDIYIKGTRAYYERISRKNKINEEIKNKMNPNYGNIFI